MKLLAVIGVAVLCFGAGLEAGWCATVKMRVVVVNPSLTKTQTKTVKNYLPKEVDLKDIDDAGGMEVDFDPEQGMLYAYKKDVELAPGETKIFEVLMGDVWMIPEEKLEALRKRTEGILDKLKDTSFYDQAAVFGKTIYERLDEILKTQNDENVTRTQHIAYYRDNLETLELIQADIEKLEKLLVTAGGTPSLDVIEEADVNVNAPSSKTTWIIIFIVLIFILVLGGAFYLTWQGQATLTQNIFSKEKDASFSEFKDSPTSGGPPSKEEPKKTP